MVTAVISVTSTLPTFFHEKALRRLRCGVIPKFYTRSFLARGITQLAPLAMESHALRYRAHLCPCFPRHLLRLPVTIPRRTLFCGYVKYAYSCCADFHSRSRRS